MSDIVNPYIAGNPVTVPEMFFGREDVFEFIKRTLIGKHRDNVIVLYGQRRTGKTSVLYQMRSHIDTRYLCIFSDLHGFALEGLSGFLWELANHIVRVLHREYQIDLPRLNRVEFMADPYSFFENEFLNQIWSVCGDRHILLMLDESIRLWEQVQAGKLEPEIFEYMRHLMQHDMRLNFLFSIGIALEEMEKEYAFLFSVGLYKKISFLDQDAVYALITQPVKDFYQVEPAAEERIFQITSGHAYYTQLLCHSIFNHWQNKQMAYINVQDVDAILDEVIELGLPVLKYEWEESTPVEKMLMAGIAASGTTNSPVALNTIKRIWSRSDVAIPPAEMEKAIRSLIAREVITGEGKYAFTVDLQRLWVQKSERIEWVKREVSGTIPERSLLPTIISRRGVLGVLIVGLAGLLVVGSDIVWRAFSQQPGTRLYTFRGHTASVNAVGWSHNGKLIASASDDKTVQIWDTTNGAHLSTYRRHSDSVNDVTWSPAGQYIASASEDQTVNIWDPATGDLIVSYSGHFGPVYAASWSPNGQRIASASGDYTVRVWDATTGNHPSIYHGHASPVRDVKWSPTGKYIASASDDQTVQVWDPVTMTNVFTYEGHSDIVYALTWSHDSKRIASASYDQTVQVWDATTGQNVLVYRGHSGPVYTVVWSPDGKFIASGGADKTVQVWDPATTDNIFVYLGHSAQVHSVDWSPDSTRIVSGAADKTVQVWQAT